MLKLGYFTITNISPSETFIYDLVKSLNQENDIDLTYITGQKTAPTLDFKLNSIASGYSEKFVKTAYRIKKIGDIKGAKGDSWKMKFSQLVAKRQLHKARLPKFDAAFVEYAISGILLMEYFQLNNIPFIVHVHGYDVTSCINDSAYLKQLRFLFDKANYFIAASQYMKRRLILLGCNEEKVKVISLGIDSNDIIPLSWSERKKLTPSIVFLGRLTEKKNPLALVHAFNIVQKVIQNAALTIIGDGPMKDAVNDEIRRLKLTDKVQMLGLMHRRESFPILNKHWIYAQHSVTAINGDTEGFAISLAEAALHELPVVSTIHNGITENVINGKTGYLVPEYDYHSMADKIIYLIENPDIAEQMGKAGREHILKLCAPEKRIEKIKELLYEVCGIKSNQE